MDLGLQGKRALVTGSTAGIGFAAAKAMAAEGAEVTINGRTAARVNAAVAQLQADLPGSSVTGVSADLGTAGGCEVMIQRRPELDILTCSVACVYRATIYASLLDHSAIRHARRGGGNDRLCVQ